MSEERIDWHAAFYSAIQLELEDYRNMLEFNDEFQLTAGSLRIDVLIVKKKQDIIINKNIAAVFRLHNILEFKGPGDSFSIDDFNKTMAYCYLYASMNHLETSCLSLTIVETGYPREALRKVSAGYGWAVTEAGTGIHLVSGAGMPFPIQIVESGKLPEEENLWIKNLNRNVSVQSLNKVLAESGKRKSESYMTAFLETVVRANKGTLLEVLKMEDLTLDEIFEQTGWAAKWEAQGEAIGEVKGEVRGEKKARKELLDLLKSGKSPEEIIRMYEDEPAKI
jgi:hypothetical protein